MLVKASLLYFRIKPLAHTFFVHPLNSNEESFNSAIIIGSNFGC